MIAAHEMLRTKKISCRELVEDCCGRIDELNATLNAVVHDNRERALEEADRIDAHGTFDHPLTGIPYLAKDIFCEEGIPTTACSNVLRTKDYLPPFNSTTTERLSAVGAISLGKTNTDEFTMGASTETSCFGPTRNPWDTTRVAGGSSGGSAAGLSTDMCLFSLGTDTGGSLRLPAAFCNVCSIRPTYGRTSRFGVMSMASSLDTIGPMGKTVEDLALILQTIAGKDPFDATTADVPVPDYSAALKQGIRGMKIGLPKEYFIDGLHPDVEAAVRQAARTLEGLGASVREISLPHTRYAVATYCVITPSEVSSNMARYDGIRYGHGSTSLPAGRPGSPQVPSSDTLFDYYLRVRSEGFGPEVKRRIMIGTYALSAGYYDAFYRKAQKVRTLLKKDFDDAFRDVDVVLAPTAPTPAFRVGAHAEDPLAMFLEDIFLNAQPMAGIPAVAVPCGFAAPQAGAPALPIGMQIMGPQWGEEIILRAAYAYEQETQWHRRKPILTAAAGIA